MQFSMPVSLALFLSRSLSICLFFSPSPTLDLFSPSILTITPLSLSLALVYFSPLSFYFSFPLYLSPLSSTLFYPPSIHSLLSPSSFLYPPLSVTPLPFLSQHYPLCCLQFISVPSLSPAMGLIPSRRLSIPHCREMNPPLLSLSLSLSYFGFLPNIPLTPLPLSPFLHPHPYETQSEKPLHTSDIFYIISQSYIEV